MKLELKGLKITWVGFLLSIIGAVISATGVQGNVGSVDNTTSAGAMISVIVSLVSVIMIIVGLTMVKKVSDHFRKARNYEIVQIIVAIVFVGLVMGLAAGKLINGAASGLTTGIVVISVIMIVILAIFSILFYKHLLKGCEDTALYAKSESLAERFRKLWKLFIVGFVIAIAGAIVMLIGLGVAVNRILTSLENALEVSNAMMRGALPGGIVLIVGAIIMFVFTILLLIRMAKLCTFDGEIFETDIKGNIDNAENI